MGFRVFFGFRVQDGSAWIDRRVEPGRGGRGWGGKGVRGGRGEGLLKV